VGVVEGLEEDAIYDSEDDGVGANADRQGDQDDRGEKRGAKKAAKHLLELISEEGHGVLILESEAGPAMTDRALDGYTQEWRIEFAKSDEW
jgi:hypothetical protein